MDSLRRLIVWERRMGPPANRALLRFWTQAFVVMGPVGVGLGVFELIHGFRWYGSGTALIGLGMSWVGLRPLLRAMRSRFGRQH